MSRTSTRVALTSLLIGAVLLIGCRKPEGPRTNLTDLWPLTEPKVETRCAPGADLGRFATYNVLGIEDPGSAVGCKLLEALVTANLELAGYSICEDPAQAEAALSVIVSPSLQQTYRPPRTAWIPQWQAGQTSTVTTSTGQSAQIHEPGRTVLNPVAVPGRTTSYRWLHVYLFVADLKVYRARFAQAGGEDPDGLALKEATLWESIASARVGNAPAYAAALPLLCYGLVGLFDATGMDVPRGVGRLHGLKFAYALIGDRLLPFVAVVEPGSPGDRAGFQRDDMIVAIDDTPTENLTPTTCRAMLIAPKDPPRTITVRRLEEVIVLRLVPGA